MSRVLGSLRTRGPKGVAATIAALAGFATAALVGVAVAKTFTLGAAKNAHVTNQAGTTATESIVVNSHGFAVYELTGDSARHPECTKGNGCFMFWPPVKVSSPRGLSKASGIRGKLGVWHRHGFFQVMLAGHPLYRYAADSQKGSANGEGIHTFGGTWHPVKVAAAGGGTTTSGGTTSTMTTTTSTMPTTTTTMPTTTTTTMPTTTTTTCTYPPYC
jgi:predicted lipoprotein with Yx(FWY)xxD motif